MGLFSFNKDAGEKTPGVSDEIKEKFMMDTIKKFNLDVKDLRIDVSGSKASIWGKVTEQSVKEKIILGVGNVIGISEVEDHLELEKNEARESKVEESKFYTVQKGDSLSKIAKEFYGDAMQYNKIFEANKPMLKNIDLIYPGQVLRIP
jgi:nucleoid-associated protein YgaU